MSLTLKDRIKAMIRMIKVAFDPKVDYINLMWQSECKVKPDNAPIYDEDEKKAIFTHTFYMKDTKPVNTLLTYMAHVAAKSDNLEDLNHRSEFYLNKVAVAYMLMNPSSDHVLQYIASPIRSVPRSDMNKDEKKED